LLIWDPLFALWSVSRKLVFLVFCLYLKFCFRQVNAKTKLESDFHVLLSFHTYLSHSFNARMFWKINQPFVAQALQNNNTLVEGWSPTTRVIKSVPRFVFLLRYNELNVRGKKLRIRIHLFIVAYKKKMRKIFHGSLGRLIYDLVVLKLLKFRFRYHNWSQCIKLHLIWSKSRENEAKQAKITTTRMNFQFDMALRTFFLRFLFVQLIILCSYDSACKSELVIWLLVACSFLCSLPSIGSLWFCKLDRYLLISFSIH
jgi:hypothetical protein